MGVDQRKVTITHTDMRQFVVVAALAAVAQGASCPDGWSKVEVKDSVECVYFGGLKEVVTKADAEVLCAARGGHLVSLADPGCSGTDRGGLEPPVWDLTANTTGETGG